MPPCKGNVHNKAGQKVKCGVCINCRINRSSEWATRLTMELPYWKESSFITLTLDDDHLHENGSLDVRDLQLFFKRVRKKYGTKLKYYACGEYGDDTGRSHYHAIVFGCDFSPWIHIGWREGRKIYTSDCLRELWPFGVVSVDAVTSSDCNYVAGYIQKKLYGQGAEYYMEKGIKPPFSVMSKGLSLNYVLDHGEQLLQNGFIWRNGKHAPLPRYVKDKLGMNCKDEFGISDSYIRAQEILSERKAAFARSYLGKRLYTEYYTPIEDINLDLNFNKYQRDAAMQSALELESRQKKRSLYEV